MLKTNKRDINSCEEQKKKKTMKKKKGAGMRSQPSTNVKKVPASNRFGKQRKRIPFCNYSEKPPSALKRKTHWKRALESNYVRQLAAGFFLLCSKLYTYICFSTRSVHCPKATFSLKQSDAHFSPAFFWHLTPASYSFLQNIFATPSK